jgi:transcriptional regulator with XRE-family HTH domain
MAEPAIKRGPGRRPAEDIDRHVGARIRERRIMLGLTLHQMAELIGLTYQQAYKYEKGVNRVSSGRLYRIAQALDTDVGYFFEGTGRDHMFSRTPSSGFCVVRNFMTIREHQEEIVSLARALAESD